MTTTLNTSEPVGVLRQAREYVDRGWVQNNYYKRIGNQHCVCSLGAIIRAASDLDTVKSAQEFGFGPMIGHVSRAAVDYLATALARKQKRSPGLYTGNDVIAFNDAKDRTKEEILDLYDRAIALAEKEAKA